MALVPSLTTSLSGMKTAQGQLDIISRNIANVDTEGYTRKTAGQNNLVLSGYPNGVSLGNITRNVNTGLLKSFLAANSQSGNLNSQYEYLSKAELLLGTPQGENAISANVGALQSAFETFASDVTSASGRYTLLNNAQTLASRLNSISTEIQKLRGEADMAITGSVEEINSLLEELDQLNQNIVKATVLKQDGLADLEDKRDQALRSLSEKIDINYFQRENGEIVVQTQNGIPLLDKEVHKLSHTAVAQSSPTSTYAGGEIWYVSNVALYGESNPKPVAEMKPEHNPWLSAQDIMQKGALVIFPDRSRILELRKIYKNMSLPYEYKLEITNKAGKVKKKTIYYGFLKPEVKND